MGILDDIDVDDILGLRDDIGAIIAPVFFVTRTWSGSEPGDGTHQDVEVQMLPSPRVKSFKNDLRIREGGAVQEGDYLLTGISKVKYTKEELDNETDEANVENYIRVGDEMCRVVNVDERYVTFEMLVRRAEEAELSDEEEETP